MRELMKESEDLRRSRGSQERHIAEERAKRRVEARERVHARQTARKGVLYASIDADDNPRGYLVAYHSKVIGLS